METPEVSSLIFDELKQVNDNNKCFDCEAENPKWASVNNGIFVCLSCIGMHRPMGAHLSFARSINLDAWNERQLKCMSVGGNKKFKDFLAIYDLENETIDYKYNTKAADYYRKKLKACAAEQDFEEPQPEYAEGRENINFVKEEAAASLGAELEEDHFAHQHEEGKEDEELKEAGVPNAEDKARASSLLGKLMSSTLQVKNKGVTIIGVGSKTVYSAAKTAVKGAASMGAKGIKAGKEGAIYAGKKGYDIGKDTYTKVKENETYKSVKGAVIKGAVDTVGIAKEFLSSVTGKGKNDPKPPADQMLAEDQADVGVKPDLKENEEEKKE